MDFFGHYITQSTIVAGPVIILIGLGQYIFYKYFFSYSERTIDDLNNNSFLGAAGTDKTPTGGKITMLIGMIIFAIMFSADFFWGSKTADVKSFEEISKTIQSPSFYENMKKTE